MKPASTVEYLVDQHRHLSAEHERFNSEGRPAFAREIRIRLEAIELAIVGVSKASSVSAEVAA